MFSNKMFIFCSRLFCIENRIRALLLELDHLIKANLPKLCVSRIFFFAIRLPSVKKLSALRFFPRTGGNVAQLVELRTRTPLTQVRLPGAQGFFFFSPRVSFRCRSSYGVRTPSCAIACINICVHVKDPVVHVRVRRIMETLKHPAFTVVLVARLCRSCFFPGKATRISHGRNPIGTVKL